MSLLSDIVQEMDAAGAAAATTTSSVAATPGSLFAGGIVDPKNAKKKRGKLLRRAMNMKTEGAMSRLKESLGVDLGGADFDASDVISRIDAASKKEKQNDDTTAFGLEDEDGSMVKVYVRNDQAKDFETQLAALLAGADEDNDEDNTSLEIAEVLYKLKDKFDIVDVEWPGIAGDEEEEQEEWVQALAPKANMVPKLVIYRDLNLVPKANLAQRVIWSLTKKAQKAH